MEEAQDIYSYLSNPCTGDVVLCRHRPLNHGNQGFIAIEDVETLLTYFSREYDGWISGRRNLSRAETRANWFKHIRRRFNFKEIFRDVARIWLTLITKANYAYTTSGEDCLLINNKGQVKIVSKFDNSISAQPNANAIDQLRNLMIRVISLPFGQNGPSDYMRRRQDYALGYVIESFLDNLVASNLMYVGPNFLLGAHEFCFFQNDKSRFIINLDEMIKRGDINEIELSKSMKTICALMGWRQRVKTCSDRELFTIFNYSEPSYRLHRASVIRFCSNVYRHCHNHSNQRFERPDVENKLTVVLPDLYIGLFEALIHYGYKSKR
ncbi:hypothetical protein V6N13_070046 [Hibiscus sabdariffa]